MGDPRKIRKKYQTPGHPWQKARIESEKIITKEYGTKNKREIWKMESTLRAFSNRAKRLIVAKTVQAEIEKKQLIAKLQALGLVPPEAGLDNVLDLALRDIMERRLQTLIYKKSLAKTVNQARQFIIHGHVTVGDRKITSPSYLVSVKEEGMIGFSKGSLLNDPEHPARIIQSESEAKKKAKKADEEGPKSAGKPEGKEDARKAEKSPAEQKKERPGKEKDKEAKKQKEDKKERKE